MTEYEDGQYCFVSICSKHRFHNKDCHLCICGHWELIDKRVVDTYRQIYAGENKVDNNLVRQLDDYFESGGFTAEDIELAREWMKKPVYNPPNGFDPGRENDYSFSLISRYKKSQ